VLWLVFREKGLKATNELSREVETTEKKTVVVMMVVCDAFRQRKNTTGSTFRRKVLKMAKHMTF